jgi:hypothetical protein
MEISNAIPTALLLLGARLFATSVTTQVNGQYRPAAMKKRKK